MDAKLTLKLNKAVIENAKFYATKKQLSLSRLIENYLNSLTTDLKKEHEIEISPFVKSLSTDLQIPADLDYKKEYGDYLAKKYQ